MCHKKKLPIGLNVPLNSVHTGHILFKFPVGRSQDPKHSQGASFEQTEKLEYTFKISVEEKITLQNGPLMFFIKNYR